jgi:fructose-bisphosphate aldolase, class II
MPLVSIREEIRKARAGGYSLPLFVTFDLMSSEGIFQALDEKRSPAMVAIYTAWLDRPTVGALVAIVKTLAREARVPVSLILDHGASLDHCRRALEFGFTDLMYDGSKLPLEENIANSRQVREMAHAAGAGCEAELGHVGEGSDYDTFGSQRKGFTDPAVAERFCAETGVDILAVAIGNAHGLYKGAPQLDLDLLADIRGRVGVPLSLHGGTGLSDDQFRAAIARGIAKVNIFTDLAGQAADNVAALSASRKASYFDILGGIREAFHVRCGHFIDVFGSAGKA